MSQDIIDRLALALPASGQTTTPTQLKQALLKSGAAAHAVTTSAHDSVDALGALAESVRRSASVLPAAAVALCMHHHVVLAMARYPALFDEASSLVKAVGQGEALVASAFAEGIPGSDIFSPSVTVADHGDGVIVQGSKKPCTLASIADYYVMSACHHGRGNTMALLLIPHRGDAIRTQPFWGLDVLRECDNQQVLFDRLSLDRNSVSALSPEQQQGVLAYGMATFNCLAAHAYAGVLDALQACVPARVSAEPAVARVLAEQGLRVQAVLTQLTALAHQADQLEHAVPTILGLRYSLESLLEDAGQFALRSCGGVEVMSSPKALSLFSTLQLYKFHPVGKFQFVSALLQSTT
jgi:alkylation response protein AidB-like acyl-CoA dehydrogenase